MLSPNTNRTLTPRCVNNTIFNPIFSSLCWETTNRKAWVSLHYNAKPMQCQRDTITKITIHGFQDNNDSWGGIVPVMWLSSHFTLNAKGSHLIFKSMSITFKAPQTYRLIGEYERGYIPLHSDPVGLLPVILGSSHFHCWFLSGEQIEKTSTELLAIRSI